MANKTLAQYLARYDAQGLQKEILDAAGDYKCRVNKEGKILELTVDFPRVYRKADIRRLEEEIRNAYSLNYVHIITHYGIEFWNNNCVDEMLLELQHRGAIAKGFFYDYDYTVDNTDKHIEIRIGFSNGGIDLMYSDNTHLIASQILKDEYDIEYTVDIVRDEEKAKRLESHAPLKAPLL